MPRDVHCADMCGVRRIRTLIKSIRENEMDRRACSVRRSNPVCFSISPIALTFVIFIIDECIQLMIVLFSIIPNKVDKL